MLSWMQLVALFMHKVIIRVLSLKQAVAEHGHILNSPLKWSTRSKVVLKMSKSPYGIPKNGTEALKLLYFQ